MLIAPYDRVKIGRLSELLELPPGFPQFADCPVCGAPASFWLRPDDCSCTCSSCLLADDALGVYATLTSRPVSAAVTDLQNQRVLDWTIRQAEYYLANRLETDAQSKLIAECRARAGSGDYPTLYRLAAAAEIDVTPGDGLQLFARHFGLLHREHLSDGVFANHHQVVKWMRRSMHLVLPLWRRRHEAGGLLLMNNKGEGLLAPFPGMADTELYTGLPGVSPTSQASTVIPDGPLDAARLSFLHQRLSGPAADTVIGTVRPSSSAAVFRPDIPSRSALVWAPSPEQAWRCWKRSDRVTVGVCPGPWRPRPNPMNVPQLLAELLTAPARFHEGMALLLADQTDDQVRQFVREAQPDPEERQTIAESAPLHARQRLDQLLLGTHDHASVMVMGRRVFIDGGRWMTESGELISDATISIDHVFDQAGQPHVSGSVWSADGTFPFTESLVKVQRGGAWLEQFLVSNGAGLPIIHPSWRRRLFHVAVAINRPQPKKSQWSVYWSIPRRQCLHLPGYELMPSTVRKVAGGGGGACSGLDIPQSLRFEALHGLSDEFWTVVVDMLARCWRVRQGLPAWATVFYGQTADLWLQAVQSGLNLGRDHSGQSIAPGTLSQTLATWPAAISAEYPPNAYASCGPQLASLLQLRGWRPVKAESHPTRREIVNLPQLFTLLAELLPDDRAILNSQLLERAVGDRVAQLFDGQRREQINRVVDRLALEANLQRSESVSGRYLTCLRNLTYTGEIRAVADDADRWYSINWNEVEAAFARQGLNCPPLAEVRYHLQGGDGRLRHVKDDPKFNGLRILTESWILGGALT